MASSEPANNLSRTAYVLGMRVDGTSYRAATEHILHWAGRSESRYVCAADVHMIMESYGCSDFRNVVNSADLVAPDGMPVVWMLRALGLREQQRVCGPDLTVAVCRAAAQENVPVGFYGGTPRAVQRLALRFKNQFSTLDVRYVHSPPFRPMSATENAEVLANIEQAGCKILFVGLGCPKQEWWMSTRKGVLKLVTLGVGAAFDFLSGEKPRAPIWMQRSGLEWAFCLACEPRRLWFRHFYHNPRFLILAAQQLVRRRFEMRNRPLNT